MIFHSTHKLVKYFYIIQTGGDDVIEDYEKKAIRKLLHANIYVHIRRLIDEFPKDGIKCIEKLQSHRANMTFADKNRYERTFKQVTQKGGESAINDIKRFQNASEIKLNAEVILFQ